MATGVSSRRDSLPNSTLRWKPTYGYGFDIVAVNREGERISIFTELITPEPRTVTSDVVTSPYQLIKWDRAELAGSMIYELIVEESIIQRDKVTSK